MPQQNRVLWQKIMQILAQNDSHFLSKISDTELEKSPFSLNSSFGLVPLLSGNKASAFKDESDWQLGSWSALHGDGGKLACLSWPNSLCSRLNAIFWSLDLYGCNISGRHTIFVPIGCGFSRGEDVSDMFPGNNGNISCFEIPSWQWTAKLNNFSTSFSNQGDYKTTALLKFREHTHSVPFYKVFWSQARELKKVKKVGLLKTRRKEI